MMKNFSIIISVLTSIAVSHLPVPLAAQRLNTSLASAMQKLESDVQFAHASISLYVADVKSGNIVYAKNPNLGLAPASCQKIITSASAFELMEKTYQYKTYIGYNGAIQDGTLNGSLVIDGRGDPTFGSWRWSSTKKEKLFKDILIMLRKNNITRITGSVYVNDLDYSFQPIPDGWIWQDMGNYFGAGAWGFNWNENQFDLNIKPGLKTGDQTEIISTTPVDLKSVLTNMITTGPKGSGDNAYIYAAPFSTVLFANGTVPAGQSKFTIAGSMPNPPLYFAKALKDFLVANNIPVSGEAGSHTHAYLHRQNAPRLTRYVDSIFSPSLDSINYWFLKKSVNLYGEAFVKTISYQVNGKGNTDSGLAIMRDYWNFRGIAKPSLKIIDGSGLSPANRLTTKSLVQVLLYSRKQNWFGSFFNALPVMNGINMKDGYINGVRSYSGFLKNKDGNTYAFAFIINNFDGSAGTAREKMWKVLDVLK